MVALDGVLDESESELKIECLGVVDATRDFVERTLNENRTETERLERQVEQLLAERDMIRMKVEAMLDAVAALDPEMAEELR